MQKTSETAGDTPRAHKRDSKPGVIRRLVRSAEQSDIAVDTRAAISTLYNKYANPGLYDDVRFFCLFIGHGRSGSTLVGALLNAHRSIVLANELNTLRCIRRRMPRERLFNHIRSTSISQARHGSAGGGGYRYAVPGQWQGKHDRISVIGDRKAGTTAIQLFREPELLKQLQTSVKVPLKFICVVRNPFDSITTTFKKTFRRPNEPAESHLSRQIDAYFDRWAAVTHVHEQLGDDHVAFVRHEDMVMDTASQLAALCRFLEIEADSEYLTACASIVKRKPSITRDTVEWAPDLVAAVRAGQAGIPWLDDYDFDVTY